MVGYSRAAASNDVASTSQSESSDVRVYKRAISLVERLHRQLLDVVKDSLDRAGYDDLTAVQALLIYNIGDHEWSAGELKTHGCYLGSNVSYNLKKLHELDLLASEKSRQDKRQTRISLTEKGRKVRDRIDSLFIRHGDTVNAVGGISADDLASADKTLGRLERFWQDQIRFKMS